MDEEIKKDELYKKLHQAALRVSFYNAAEGVSWGKEESLRRKASIDFLAISNEFQKKYGQEVLNEILTNGGYLLVGDYIF